MKCPCERCITFIMCKERLYNGHKQQVTSLSKKCPMLDDWIQEDTSRYKRKSINLARSTFGLGSVESTWKCL